MSKFSKTLVDHALNFDCISRSFSIFQNNILNNVVEQIKNTFYEFNNLIIDATWVFYINYEEVRNSNFDNVFLISLVDDPTNLNILEKLNNHNCSFKSVYQIGNIDETISSQDYFIQYTSVLVKEFFKFIPEDQIKLSNTDNIKTYLCYQNKVRNHRLLLTNKFIEQKIVDLGVMTLNGYLDIPENKKVEFVGNGITKEDPFTFGDLTIWNNCFLNIVSETIFDRHSLFFTEKTFKPLIGLRPFVIFGNYRILNYLQDKGFYIFEEYWNECFTTEMTVNECITKIISLVRFLHSKSKQEILNMYEDMYPKLLHNRNLFFDHAKTENQKLLNIFYA